ncbi:hypothetical protein O181_095549 [Austropuccinia psidii MF-1]|uniref:Uncharacterized protein n=1 Tax=Austropuccinia psidii MF-1 TaxID=1389203 RepID=A0A9Q3J5I8_9BASI|nr:hypothetical protein [Austropuccinia psidii MF-1]
MSNSKKDNSHAEGSNRHIHEPLEGVLRSVQGQRLGNVATNPPSSDEVMTHSQKVPQEGANSKILHLMREASKEEAPAASISKPQGSQTPQEGRKNKKWNWSKPPFPSYRIPRMQKDATENVCKMARTLMEFKDKKEQRMRQPHILRK